MSQPKTFKEFREFVTDFCMFHNIPIPKHISETSVDYEAIWENAILQLSAESDDDRFILTKIVNKKPISGTFGFDDQDFFNSQLVGNVRINSKRFRM